MRDMRTWAAIAAAWSAKRRRGESDAVDLGDMATSPEAALAASLVAAATMPARHGGLNFWGCGHALDGAPAHGLDFDAVGAAGREDRLRHWRQSDGQQARMLRAVARWRADGGTPEAEPVWTRSLSSLLRAYVNACDDWDLCRVDDDAQPGPELAARLREYREAGAVLAYTHPDLGDVHAGPPQRHGMVPLPSWRRDDPPADDSPTAPAPPAPPGGAKP